MKLLFFCPRWGQEHTPWDTFLQNVKEAGYDGVECSLPLSEREQEEILSGFSKYNLQFIAQHWETVDPNFEKHCLEYQTRLQSLANAKPLFINTQTGKDYYSFQQNGQLISIARDIAKNTGVSIIHETHRGKFSFAAHVTKFFLEQIPDLRITLDISHWCNTAETFLQDQADAVNLALSRTDHLHSRVGYTEGPQVPDPRAPEWQEALQFHLNWWDQVIERQRINNKDQFTITSEFGAPPYMLLLPHTRQPVVDQWEVNMYMMNLLKDRYK
ncbi:sugar phosphate isomerase/epimerase family protein [Segetibacter koreensis]|uniref:sugar phosphate isomerase/epimerase family protein n=1 Tax=Segetibacter koreensis TaxID=398037 RepID=UPI0003668BDA|nr:sugar phosphate isomerase/epimerase [Segetibacter koreensis]